MRIFLSYRRSDAGGWTSKLFAALEAQLGEGSVFMDHEGLRAGEDFETRILDEVDRSVAVVAVIGSEWTGRTTWYKRASIHRRADWVRRELERAGESKSVVFPVLVGDAVLPSASSLPPTIAYLQGLQATALRPERWDDDVTAFLVDLERSLSAPCDVDEVIEARGVVTSKYRRRRHLRAGLAAAATLAVACSLLLFLMRGSPTYSLRDEPLALGEKELGVCVTGRQ